MTATMPMTGTIFQTFSLTTDVTQSHPSIICNMSATLTPAAAYISLSADFQTITVDKTNLPTGIGTYPFTVTIDSVEYAGNVTTKILSFNVEVVCIISSFSVTSKPADASYYLNQGSIQTLPLDLI